MRLELNIERLRVERLELPGMPAHARGELARVIGEQLEQLLRSRGAPWGAEVGEISIGRVTLESAAGASLAEVASSIARQLVTALEERVPGSSPWPAGRRDDVGAAPRTAGDVEES